MSFLVDTDIVSAHLRSGGELTSRFLQYTGGLNLSVISLGELFTWTLRKNTPTRHHEALLNLLEEFHVLDVTADVVQVFGAVRADLRDQGIAVFEMDMLIAATALLHDLTLVTHNARHFEKIPGLRLVDWLER
jgi:tRNA(fMet)-specific endonuclease VapC